MKTKFTYRHRKINRRKTRKLQQGGATANGGPVDTQALLSTISINFQSIIGILTANGTIGPIKSIFNDLISVIFDPIVSKELADVVASLKENPQIASALLNMLASGGATALSEPKILQFFQTLQMQYKILKQPEMQTAIMQIIEALLPGRETAGIMVQSILKSGTGFLTRILANDKINISVNNILLNMEAIIKQSVVQTAINNMSHTPQMSTGPSPTTTGAAATTTARATTTAEPSTTTAEPSTTTAEPSTTTVGMTPVGQIARRPSGTPQQAYAL